MDIELLSRMVGELILDNDRVSLPGIGTLVAVQMPASFSDRGYTINPPYRKLSAMADSDDDGLLTDLYASSNSIDKEAARLIVSDFMEKLAEELEESRCVYLTGLGRLRKTRDGSLFFVEDENLNIDSVGYRLEPVSLKTHPAFPDFEPMEAVLPEAEPLEQETLKQSRIVVRDDVVQGDDERHAELVSASGDNEKGDDAQLEPESDKHTHWFVKLLIWLLVLAVIALIAIAVLGRVAPEIADKILYNAEELRILYY